ncbi:uncharacterized protein LOC116413513 [Galleria mellonella]|uniref:Uncharacterized protein LOC116413513 n=1 Tax=Galleria mellonella TaxID=7137 RepID=A0ABM3N658_GALME|nr:uncharacterized protein LOC116413513 [Galleria mellonella]
MTILRGEWDYPKNINCLRCKYIMAHAQKLLERIDSIDKKNIVAICEHCRLKGTRSFCYVCNEIVKKFRTSTIQQKESKERLKNRMNKIQNLLKESLSNDKSKRPSHFYSDFDINKIYQESPKLKQQSDVGEIAIKKYKCPSIQVVPVIDNLCDVKLQDTLKNKTETSYHQLQKHEKQITFLESSTNKSDVLSDDNILLMNNESYPQSDREILYDTSKLIKSKTNSEKFERNAVDSYLKIAKQLFPYSIKKINDGDFDTTIVGLRPNLKSVSTTTLKYNVKKDIKSISDQITATNKTQQSSMSFENNYINKQKIKQMNYSTPITKYLSQESLQTSITGVPENLLKENFSFIFPKVIKKDKKILKRVSSTELIKETKYKVVAKAKEDELKRIERIRRKKEKNEKKKIKRKETQDNIRLNVKSKTLDAKIKHSSEESVLNKLKSIEMGSIKTVIPDEDFKPDINFSKQAGKDTKLAVSEKDSKSKILSINRKESKKEYNLTNKNIDKMNTNIDVQNQNKNLKQGNDENDKSEKEMQAEEEKQKLKKELQEKEEMIKLSKEMQGKAATDKLSKETRGKYITDKLKKETQHKEETDAKRKEKEGKEKNDKLSKDMPEKIKKESKEIKIEQNKNIREKEVKDDVTPLQKTKIVETYDDKMKIQHKYEGKKRDTDKVTEEQAKLELKKMFVNQIENKFELEPKKVNKNIEMLNTKELTLEQIKSKRDSSDNLILDMVKIKKSKEKDEILKPISKCHISELEIKRGRTRASKKKGCIRYTSSDIDLDIESTLKIDKEVIDIIVGDKIVKCKSQLPERRKEKELSPILFKSTFKEKSVIEHKTDIVIPEETELRANTLSTKRTKTDQEVPKGIIRYALSDRTFIYKGWTMLPTEKVVRKMNVYRMRPAHPEFDWFEHNKNKRFMQYDTGERLAEFDDNGRGQWYYRNGRLALDYYDAEEINAQQRFVIYSSGEPDNRGRSHPITILATFDYLGNGIVFDHAGKIRLKYNQTEGVVLDRNIGPVSHWKWHTLNDPPVLQQVMIDTQMAHKDSEILKLGSPADDKIRPDDEEMLAIEFDNFIKEKSKKLSEKFKPFQIKMKALKINEYFSLRVLDQANVYLIYRDGSTNLKLNIGMVLDHKEILDTDTAEVGEVSNNLERLPARTDSLAGLQRSVAYAQRIERSHVQRERRLRPTEPCASADQLTAAISRPLRLPSRTVSSSSRTNIGECQSKCRKPSTGLYYDTRII